MDFPKLRLELITDPVTLGYAGKADQQAADLLNSTTTGRTATRTSVTKREVFNAIVDADWPSTAVLQNKLIVLFSQDAVDPSNTNVRGVIASIFGAGTTSRANLLALSTQTVSRAAELGLEVVQAGHVQGARANLW